VPRLLEEPLEEIARGEDIDALYAPFVVQYGAYIELVKKHAVVKGSPDNVVHLGPSWHGHLISAAHILDAQPNTRNLERTQLSALCDHRARRPAPVAP